MIVSKRVLLAVLESFDLQGMKQRYKWRDLYSHPMISLMWVVMVVVDTVIDWLMIDWEMPDVKNTH